MQSKEIITKRASPHLLAGSIIVPLNLTILMFISLLHMKALLPAL